MTVRLPIGNQIVYLILQKISFSGLCKPLQSRGDFVEARIPQLNPTLVRGSDEFRPLCLLLVVAGVAIRRPGPNESDGVGCNGLRSAAWLRHVLVVEGDPVVRLAATGLAGLYRRIRKAIFRCWVRGRVDK